MDHIAVCVERVAQEDEAERNEPQCVQMLEIDLGAGRVDHVRGVRPSNLHHRKWRSDDLCPHPFLESLNGLWQLVGDSEECFQQLLVEVFDDGFLQTINGL